MTNATIEIRPIAGAMGAEVLGVDLTQPLENSAFDAIHRALLAHHLLVFRDQGLTPGQQAAFGRRFGPLCDYPFIEGLPEEPNIFAIVKDKDDRKNFGGNWHSDTTYEQKPPFGTMLYAKEVPAAGGDTLFSNTRLAYEALSDGMKLMIADLVGVNSAALRGRGGRTTRLDSVNKNMQAKGYDRVNMEAEHPVVRTHPDTGQKSLFVNPAHTIRFKGMSDEESAPLIKYLCDHSVRPEFTCRVRWQVGTLGLWDNRCTQHFALDDYHGHRRVMHRLTIEGERPF